MSCRVLWVLAVCAGTAALAQAQTCSNQNAIPTACGFDAPTDFSPPPSTYGFYWTDATGTVTVEQPTGWGCAEHTCNQFSARITNRISSFAPWAGGSCSPGPVVLFVPGGAMNNYPSEAEIDPDDEEGVGDDPPAGERLLYKKLYEKGARILEIRYRCQMLNDAILFYKGTGSCQHTLLTAVLQKLNQRNIIEHPPGKPAKTTTEPWWPGDVDCRFAMGASEGETQLQFAVDVMDNARDGGIGVMNRVVYGGGGTPYDIRGTVDCGNAGDDLLAGCAAESNDSCRNLEQVHFFFNNLADDVVDECGGCWNDCTNPPVAEHAANCQLGGLPPNQKNCAGNPQLEGPLDAASVATYIGPNSNPADDHQRILGAVLVNTGLDHGINELANTSYLQRRESVANGPDNNEATWQVTHCLCGCPFWGHGTLNRTYEMFKNANLPNGASPVDDWTDFFVSGDLTFNLYDLADDFPAAICPADPDCEIFAPPDEVVHAPSCGS